MGPDPGGPRWRALGQSLLRKTFEVASGRPSHLVRFFFELETFFEKTLPCSVRRRKGGFLAEKVRDALITFRPPVFRRHWSYLPTLPPFT